MQKQLVVTVIGADKPGIVESLAAVISREQGNWLGSAMSELAGQFAGILHVSVPDEHYRSLCEALALLPGLTISFAEGTPTAEPAQSGPRSKTSTSRPAGTNLRATSPAVRPPPITTISFSGSCVAIVRLSKDQEKSCMDMGESDAGCLRPR